MIAGERITSSLKLVRPLGAGGMGAVWLAEHLSLGTRVAVKLMAPSVKNDPVAYARFRREATAAAQIQSPHVARAFDHGETRDGTPYIVMELLEGEDLKRHVVSKGLLSLRQTVALVTQTCKALSKAHEAGIIHRDIKPGNLFLVDMGGEIFVKVLDFGIAKQETGGASLGVTATGNIMGTPFFMSPEQFKSTKSVDRRTDLWSLAVVAYYALTGAVPFPGETLGEVCAAVLAGSHSPPSAKVRGIPRSVDAWFQRAFHQNIDMRFRSAQEMAEALQEAFLSASGSPSSATLREGLALSSGDTGKSSQVVAEARRPVLWLFAASVLVGALLVLVLVWGLDRSHMFADAPSAASDLPAPSGPERAAAALVDSASAPQPSSTPMVFPASAPASAPARASAAPKRDAASKSPRKSTAAPPSDGDWGY